MSISGKNLYTLPNRLKLTSIHTMIDNSAMFEYRTARATISVPGGDDVTVTAVNGILHLDVLATVRGVRDTGGGHITRFGAIINGNSHVISGGRSRTFNVGLSECCEVDVVG